MSNKMLIELFHDLGHPIEIVEVIFKKSTSLLERQYIKWKLLIEVSDFTYISPTASFSTILNHLTAHKHQKVLSIKKYV